MYLNKENFSNLSIKHESSTGYKNGYEALHKRNYSG